MHQLGLFDTQLQYDKIEAYNHALAKMIHVIDIRTLAVHAQ